MRNALEGLFEAGGMSEVEAEGPALSDTERAKPRESTQLERMDRLRENPGKQPQSPKHCAGVPTKESFCKDANPERASGIGGSGGLMMSLEDTFPAADTLRLHEVHPQVIEEALDLVGRPTGSKFKTERHRRRTSITCRRAASDPLLRTRKALKPIE